MRKIEIIGLCFIGVIALWFIFNIYGVTLLPQYKDGYNAGYTEHNTTQEYTYYDMLHARSLTSIIPTSERIYATGYGDGYRKHLSDNSPPPAKPMYWKED